MNPNHPLSDDDSNDRPANLPTNVPVGELAMMRLVDGELESAERAKLLNQLESHPDGWRDCALAFLEDQAWRQAMTEPGLQREQNTIATTTATTTSRRSTERSFFATLPGLLSLAAALLLAFAVGKWSPTNRDNGDYATAPENSIGERSPMIAKNDGEDRLAPPHVAAADAGKKMGAEVNAFDQQGQPLVMMDEQFWKHDSSLPIEFQKQLESLGAKVKRERGLMPVRANDGQEWIVPYEDVRVVPVMNVRM